jgi:hypothetical protein
MLCENGFLLATRDCSIPSRNGVFLKNQTLFFEQMPAPIVGLTGVELFLRGEEVEIGVENGSRGKRMRNISTQVRLLDLLPGSFCVISTYAVTH